MTTLESTRVCRYDPFTGNGTGMADPPRTLTQSISSAGVSFGEENFNAIQYQDLLDRPRDLYAECKCRILADWLGSRSPMRILNAGCGSGELSFLLARRGHRVIGVDLVPEY